MDPAGTLIRNRSLEEHEADVLQFLRAGRSPRFDPPWRELLYTPKPGLMTLLTRLDFTVYVVSGSSNDFPARW